MKSKSVVLLLFYFLLPVSIFAGNSDRKISLQLLKEAREANELGDIGTARVLFKKAKLADKRVELPGWVTGESSQAKTQSKIAHQLIRKEDGARLIFNYQANPDEPGRKLLEAYLKQYPEATEIRQKFEQQASLVGHETGLKKEIHKKDSYITLNDLKIFVLITLVLILIWQTTALVYEFFSQGRGEK